MKKLIFSLFMAFIATTALWASNVISYTATEKLPEVTTDIWDIGLHINAFNVAITSHEFSNGTGTITFADEVSTIGKYAFTACEGLISITIPNSVTTIGYGAFSSCKSLTFIQIPNSVKTIGERAFENCTGLTSVTIPNSVTTIGDEAFMGCTGLTSPLYNANCFAFMPENYTGSYTIPSGIKQIAGGAFLGCSGLTSITIPNSVTTIGEWAFNSCRGLTSITCEAITPPTCGSSCFSGVDKSIPLYVPSSSINAYQLAPEWKEFYNIQAMAGDALDNIRLTNPAQKVLHNGQLIIDRNGQHYSAMGERIR